MEIASGEIWLFLDDDVELEPSFIEELLRAYAQESSVFLESSQTIANRIYSNTCGSLYSSGVSSTMIASRSTGTRRDS